MKASTDPTPPRGSTLVLVLCGVLILFDGYDLVVYGNVVPALLAEPGWGLTEVDAGRIASLTLVGMSVGALLAGLLADRFGRRRVIMMSVLVFSTSMAACALATLPLLFEVARALGGVGLGAMFPSATALIMEFARPGRQAMSYSLAFFGYLIGGIAAAGLGMLLIEQFGWRTMFWIGAVPLLLFPVLLRHLPESPAWLVSRGRREEAHRIAERSGLDTAPLVPRPAGGSTWSAVFAPGYRTATVTLWLIQFCSLLLVTGMVTWLPSMMHQIGYSLGFALGFVLILNCGAAIGAVVAARSADRIGAKKPVVALFVLGGAGLFILALQPQPLIAFALIAVAGAGTLGAQILVNAFGASLYPDAVRGSGLGWALAVGRTGAIAGPVVFGAVMATDSGAITNFYVLAGIGVLGALLAACLPLTPAAREAISRMRRETRKTAVPPVH
ncbi:MFS transporter [Halostreptopolyspora alba]|uniref:MFS transporter n=1 Tax=Halostreptopolyspora alba TaxID=2487137 RepID=A0A3N0EI30_9ACTN|nr:MFS transporter [Nocardiopsaceae bacterium YIM 96095]